jgi:hypothetical protein
MCQGDIVGEEERWRELAAGESAGKAKATLVLST